VVKNIYKIYKYRTYFYTIGFNRLFNRLFYDNLLDIFERSSMTRLVITALPLKASPQMVFLRLKTAGLLHTVLLETVQAPHVTDCVAQSTAMPRWSYIAGPALATLQCLSGETALTVHSNSNAQVVKLWLDPFQAMRDVLNSVAVTEQINPTALHPLGLQFTSGLVGFLGYDLVRSLEQLPSIAVSDIATPDLYLHVCDHVLAYDHLQQQWYVCTHGLNSLVADVAIDTASRSLVWENTVNIACNGLATTNMVTVFERDNKPFKVSEPCFKTAPTDYLTQAESVLEYIRAGDILQANLSHRVEGSFTGDTFALYQALTQANPAPYSAYIEGENFTVASVSPEQFLRVQHRQVTAKPIKGTRSRYTDVAQDQMAKHTLKQSIKDRAENVMIVDLMRNDIGRVARIGSVKVQDLFEIEAHPSVWQMVSTITANLEDTKDTVDLLQACWPPGSMTGAPKIRAMEIIDSLEPVRRGIYSGAIGYFDCSGAVDLSVVIRTAIVAQGRVNVQVGGAVVADSNAQAELYETYVKGKRLFETLGWKIKEQ
jgi:para-aminobenzoate synthetase component I